MFACAPFCQKSYTPRCYAKKKRAICTHINAIQQVLRSLSTLPPPPLPCCVVCGGVVACSLGPPLLQRSVHSVRPSRAFAEHRRVVSTARIRINSLGSCVRRRRSRRVTAQPHESEYLKTNNKNNIAHLRTSAASSLSLHCKTRTAVLSPSVSTTLCAFCDSPRNCCVHSPPPLSFKFFGV